MTASTTTERHALLIEDHEAAPAVLIPAYRPSTPLLRTLGELRRRQPRWPLVVVDDGSGPTYDAVFDAATAVGADVLRVPVNRGKGAALKTGLAHVARTFPGSPVVCADADGQHAVADIVAVADRVTAAPEKRRLVIGTRVLDGSAPWRSRFGNSLTRWLFTLATRRRLADTQTGLRGIPADLVDWAAAVPGRRYEYELRMLLGAARAGVAFEVMPIETIYLDHNSASHFRPLADSIRIYVPLLAFLASSVTAFAVDTVGLVVLQALTGDLLVSVLGARLTSAGVNFAVNRSLVFDPARRCRTRTALTRYVVLATALVSLNYLLLRSLIELGLGLLPAKVLTELALVALSFAAQRRIVFAVDAQATHKVSPLRGQAG